MTKNQWTLGRAIAKIYRQTQMWMDYALEPLGLGKGLYQYLVEVERSPGESQHELARLMGVDEASVTRGARKLLALGYAERRGDSRDGRVRRLYLTPSGEEVLRLVHQEFCRWSRAACGDMEEKEVLRLTEFLRQSADRLEEQYGFRKITEKNQEGEKRS